MDKVIRRVDSLAGIDAGNAIAAWMERIAFVFLLLMTVAAPHSIAATQIAWLTGMAIWFVSLLLRRGSGSDRNPPRVISYALWAFFGWTALTAFTSYAPDISLDKLRGAAVFLIFYFVYHNARTLRAVHLLAFALIGSCLVSALWAPIERGIGRGVEVHGLAPNSALTRARLHDGDALLESGGQPLRSPDDVVAAIRRNEQARIRFYRPDFEYEVTVERAHLLPADDALGQLGITSWKKSYNWRSRGFYGHYVTFAEVLQLIGSLAVGLLLTFFIGRRVRTRAAAFLILASLAIGVALLLTVTRAPQLALLVSVGVMVLVALGRKALISFFAVAVPLALIGVLFLGASRQVGFFDANDDSIKWRQTIWSEAVELWTDSPRNFVLGVGMDSIKRYAPEWRLFDEGRLPPGHFHSTPLNLVVERGLPAVLLWFFLLIAYGLVLIRGIARSRDHTSYGILLGSLGGAIGFFISGIVHYNLGDQEVAMMFFLLMGLSVRTAVVANTEAVKSV